MSKKTAIVLSLETPVRSWVDKGVLFEDEYDKKAFCEIDLTSCVVIAEEQSFLPRAKKMQTLVCPYGQPCQLIFYTCLRW